MAQCLPLAARAQPQLAATSGTAGFGGDEFLALPSSCAEQLQGLGCAAVDLALHARRAGEPEQLLVEPRGKSG